MDDIAAKLDAILIKTNAMEAFTPKEVASIRTAKDFVEAFHGDPTTLKRMSDLYTAVEGFVKITKTVAIILAFIVVGWTQIDRMRELIGIVSAKP